MRRNQTPDEIAEAGCGNDRRRAERGRNLVRLEAINRLDRLSRLDRLNELLPAEEGDRRDGADGTADDRSGEAVVSINDADP